MIWNILMRNDLDVMLPMQLTRATMYPLIAQALDENTDARSSRMSFDFSKLDWIDPAGIVVLSNLFEYLKKAGVKFQIKGHERKAEAIQYLDDSQFFVRYAGKAVSAKTAIRNTTIPLNLVQKERVFEFLEAKLIPWIGDRVDMNVDSLATIKMCLEEVFLNIDHHSEVKIGCSFAQHYPKKNQVYIAVSDFGVGIPTVVRRKVPGLDDKDAIWQACQEGFSTKSNVRNRGAGLPNLMRYVAQKNQGTVLIDSGKGSLSAVSGEKTLKLARRSASGYYPGTFVQILFRTDTLERFAEDVEPEEFAW